MECRIGKHNECKAKGCAFEMFGEVNCKDFVEKPILPIFKTEVKKVKQKNKPKKLAPVHKNDLSKTELVYNRSNGICYICGESINKDEFRIYHTVVIKYTSKQNKYYKNSDSVLRARHKKCKLTTNN